MIRNIIFDFGGVLVDWNPHYLFDGYFGDADQATWFLDHICTNEWNRQFDGGKPFAEGIAELKELFPEWTREIGVYWTEWERMMGEAIPGMYEVVADLKAAGYGVYGLTNWSAETFYRIEKNYPVFALLDGKIVSGDVKLLKPDAAIFQCLLDRYGLKAEESVFIDDTPSNVEGARKAGLSALPFTGAAQLRDDLHRLLAQ